MATATTVRLLEGLHERLSAYCEQVGAVRNRVIALAVASYLDEGPAPALPVQPPGDEPAAAREAALLRKFAHDLDAREVEA